MNELLVGCPVYRREWIMPAWFYHVEMACAIAAVKPSYIFVGDEDDPTMEIIQNFCSLKNRNLFLVNNKEESLNDYRRTWNHKRYSDMVFLRNLLLAEVRKISPIYFLSLDSDILIVPRVIAELLESVLDYDAVGGKTYMTPGIRDVNCPSFAMLPRGRIKRYECHKVMQVDAIMAIKLMSPSAYKVDYEFHAQGEDIGWSLACTRAGLRLGWDGRTPSKHIMSKDFFERYDPRCGF